MNKESGAFIYPESAASLEDLQQRMIMTFRGEPKEEDVLALKKEYMDAYPDQQEGIEVLFSVGPMLKTQAEIDSIRDKMQAKGERGVSKELRDALTSMTEYGFLITNFLWKNGGERQFIEMLWQAFDKIAYNLEGAQKNISTIHGMRKGIVSQVATLRLFEKLGLKPELSKPKEDAMKSIDLWADVSHEQAIQVKTGHEDEPNVIETDHVPAVTIQFGPEGRRDLYASKEYSEARNFKTKVEEYRRAEKRPDMKGYLIVIPASKIDPVTGEPSDELAEAIRTKMPAAVPYARAA